MSNMENIRKANDDWCEAQKVWRETPEWQAYQQALEDCKEANDHLKYAKDVLRRASRALKKNDAWKAMEQSNRAYEDACKEVFESLDIDDIEFPKQLEEYREHVAGMRDVGGFHENWDAVLRQKLSGIS